MSGEIRRISRWARLAVAMACIIFAPTFSPRQCCGYATVVNANAAASANNGIMVAELPLLRSFSSVDPEGSRSILHMNAQGSQVTLIFDASYFTSQWDGTVLRVVLRLSSDFLFDGIVPGSIVYNVSHVPERQDELENPSSVCVHEIVSDTTSWVCDVTETVRPRLLRSSLTRNFPLVAPTDGTLQASSGLIPSKHDDMRLRLDWVSSTSATFIHYVSAAGNPTDKMPGVDVYYTMEKWHSVTPRVIPEDLETNLVVSGNFDVNT